ncbi:sodium:glutamate symporter [Egibacter rhizosphaerae]|uniref:Sodium:glutamate symporter n=1 Tax=Egibacter rhizosphaerae TaxID=1670831 RepID=A0A411YB29_9ACTN|nr:sodium:glutamate symporter [Egibacter rhizosphaerae]QBI18395.1 sodium:glutamate symporter [Egibacter rhizosphaerae]
MTPDAVGLAIVLIGGIVLLGKLLRAWWGVAQRLFLPASILAGFLALVLGPDVLGAAVGAVFGEEAALADGVFGETTLEVWETLPELLITVVFATLFLGHRIPSPRTIWERGGPQLSLGLTMGAGQYVLGIALTALVLTPMFGINPVAGAMIEIGFEGGHGTAAGLSGTFDAVGFPEGADLTLGMATVGIVGGILLGVALVNIGARTGRTEILDAATQHSADEQRGIFGRFERGAAATMTVRPSSIEPLTIHFAFVAVAILVGVVLLEGLQALEDATWGAQDVEVIEHVPLFPLAMVGGALVQLLIDRFDDRALVDRAMMMRIQGISLDVLIVAALATLSLDVIGEHLASFLALAAVGLAWNVLAFWFLAPRMIPIYPYERGLTDFGQSMGVTATGLILLRIVDPENTTPALESFGYKQLGFEPLLGGGLVTALSVPLIGAFGPWPLFAAMFVLLVVALVVGIGYFGRQQPLQATEDG